jgi:D-glycero-alpha-D-manno-heptose-7-phosphate kinase
MEIYVSAPNRIDLAGGTTDIYPLCLLMEGGCVVNAAIDTYSSVTIKTRAAGPISVISKDLGEGIEIEDPESADPTGKLGLVIRAVKALPPPDAVEIITENQAPAGSGLGASSALLVALLQGLSLMRGELPPSPDLVELACEVETASIGAPAGKQDYIAAACGSISMIDFHIGPYVRLELAYLDKGQRDLADHIILSHTGESRFSGVNNWEMTKGFIENIGQTREKLVKIRDIAREMKPALQDQDWKKVSHLMAHEWEIRRTLADGVTTRRIESIVAAAKDAGAWASKICGAGGGGFMITMCEPENRSRVQSAIQQAGGSVAPMKFDYDGVQAALKSE